jgi:hypothetical protein
MVSQILTVFSYSFRSLSALNAEKRIGMSWSFDLASLPPDSLSNSGNIKSIREVSILLK